jgi:Ankyrin repeats (3 copies)/SH2 domain
MKAAAPAKIFEPKNKALAGPEAGMLDAPWYFGNIDREVAEMILNFSQVDTFLIRTASQTADASAGNCVLSTFISAEEHIAHTRINRNPATGNFSIQGDTRAPPGGYESLVHLVLHAARLGTFSAPKLSKENFLDLLMEMKSARDVLKHENKVLHQHISQLTAREGPTENSKSAALKRASAAFERKISPAGSASSQSTDPVSMPVYPTQKVEDPGRAHAATDYVPRDNAISDAPQPASDGCLHQDSQGSILPAGQCGQCFLDLVELGDKSWTEYLASKSAVSAVRPQTLQNALHLGAASGLYSDFVTLFGSLMDVGVDVSAVDIDGNTPLHIAAAAGHRDIALYLVASRHPGVLESLSAKNRAGKRPRQAAAQNGHRELADDLKHQQHVLEEEEKFNREREKRNARMRDKEDAAIRKVCLTLYSYSVLFLIVSPPFLPGCQANRSRPTIRNRRSSLARRPHLAIRLGRMGSG